MNAWNATKGDGLGLFPPYQTGLSLRRRGTSSRDGGLNHSRIISRPISGILVAGNAGPRVAPLAIYRETRRDSEAAPARASKWTCGFPVSGGEVDGGSQERSLTTWGSGPLRVEVRGSTVTAREERLTLSLGCLRQPTGHVPRP